MTPQDALSWLEELLGHQLKTQPAMMPDMRAGRMVPSGGTEFVHADKVQWVTEAQIALAAIFPAGHAIHRSWNTLIPKSDGGISDGTYTSLRAVVEAAANVVRAGRLTSLLDGVRAQTVNEVLDQAYDLLNASYLVAAAVLAGGALETCTVPAKSRQSATREMGLLRQPTSS